MTLPSGGRKNGGGMGLRRGDVSAVQVETAQESRAEQSRAEQSRKEQSTADQSRSEQSMAKQSTWSPEHDPNLVSTRFVS